MATPTNAIFVPLTGKGAYNHDRLAGKLLQTQILHLREALTRHHEEVTAVLAIDHTLLKTEGQVSAYIHRATALLHTHSAQPPRK